MRYDMPKVIVERPRMKFPGIGSAYPRGHLKNPWRNNLEDSPRIESMGGRYAEKCLNENLQPLVRFLRSSVGRPWNKVHAEIAARISCSSAVQKHVLDHLHGYVEEHVWLNGKVAYSFGSWGGRLQPLTSRGMQFRFYVCPKSGLLRLAPMAKRKGGSKSPEDPNRRRLPNGIELRRIAGIWYEVKFEKVVEGMKLENKIVEADRSMVHKRQLNSREIMRYELEVAS